MRISSIRYSDYFVMLGFKIRFLKPFSVEFFLPNTNRSLDIYNIFVQLFSLHGVDQ